MTDKQLELLIGDKFTGRAWVHDTWGVNCPNANGVLILGMNNNIPPECPYCHCKYALKDVRGQQSDVK